MADVLKVGVKGEDGLVKAIAADNDGHIQTGKLWNTKVFPTWSQEIRDTTAIINTWDVSNYGLISLRIRNNTDQPITVRFNLDIEPTSSVRLCDPNGEFIELVVPASPSAPKGYYRLYTPEQIPYLNYVNLLTLEVQATEGAPTVGTFYVQVVAKR